MCTSKMFLNPLLARPPFYKPIDTKRGWQSSAEGALRAEQRRRTLKDGLILNLGGKVEADECIPRLRTSTQRDVKIELRVG